MGMTRAILLSLVLLLAVAPAAEAAKRRVPQGFFGAMYDRGVASAPEADQDEQNALMARSGVESARAVFSWAAAQPQPDQPPDLSQTDALVARMTRRGIRVLPVVISTPEWARRYPDLAASPPTSLNDYAGYLRALIERYGLAGSFWGGRWRRVGRPGQQGQGRRRTQRDRPAGRLVQLQGHEVRLHREVRHQDQRQQPGRGLR
jgi:hypothetical protein